MGETAGEEVREAQAQLQQDVQQAEEQRDASLGLRPGPAEEAAVEPVALKDVCQEKRGKLGGGGGTAAGASCVGLAAS
ncbi:hypothetical protein [Zavarzinella formosa]|uniref:hypothetical protein n=1 Tax=Zavarzinella formosa TaxID=360055 RepID=UPI0002F28F80|nr:hypothetical protein [Zavarzinella formosa]